MKCRLKISVVLFLVIFMLGASILRAEFTAHPKKPIKPKHYKSGMMPPDPKDNKVIAEAKKEVLLQPTMEVDKEDVGKKATLVMYIYLPQLRTGFFLPPKTVTLEAEQKFLNLPKKLDFSKAKGMIFDVYYGYRLSDKTLKFNTFEVEIGEGEGEGGGTTVDCSKYTDESSCKSDSNCYPVYSDLFGSKSFKKCILNCQQYTSETKCESAFDGSSCSWKKVFAVGICTIK